ncbi:hypothetical protein [Humisphaera borealis]|uniref:Uncharacterized protein n=1 Tax=Humisphaera borealis TaxID=2807512 RepID=A0A7M2X467_9BACT|nr:hypothetical protein [Humisphaera borealis]QOV91831.1 hypothetical protein IPV69_10950 [Humisphaera borealis]
MGEEPNEIRVFVANGQVSTAAAVFGPGFQDWLPITQVFGYPAPVPQYQPVYSPPPAQTTVERRQEAGSWLVRVRAKNSRGDRKRNIRDFTIRVYDEAGSEHVIRFTNAAWHDFEMRSGDWLRVSQKNGKVVRVANQTTGEVYSVTPPGCLQMVILLVAIPVLAILMF